MMEKIVNFKLVLEMGGSFHMRHKTTLDGLLSAAVYNMNGKVADDTYPFIPLVREEGIFKGSSIIFPSKTLHTSFDRGMKLTSLDKDVNKYRGSGKKGERYKVILDDKGDYKNNLSWYQAREATEVYFYGRGDGEKVADLIRKFIPGLGKRVNGGAGEILGVTWFETEDDFSWVLPDGSPARPLPVAVWKKISSDARPTAMLTVRPPYWMTEAVDAVFPA